MIISPGRRYIFVHIPKTGGTALSLALEARAMRDDILIGDTPKARARKARAKALAKGGDGRVWKHSTLADVEGALPEGAARDWFTLTLVRNPWDRMVSYYHWLRGQSFAHPAVGLARALDFSAFLNHPQTRTAMALWPYGAYLRDRAGQDRGRLYARLEHLAEDLAPFEAHLGFRLGSVARANESLRPADWRPLYSDADAALVAHLCAEDISRFGYGFDGLS